MHYDDQTLFQYVEGTSPICEEIRAHVGACADCAAEVESHYDVLEALRLTEAWGEDEAGASAGADAIVTFTRQLADEDAAASLLCDEILVGPSSWWATRLRRTEGVMTAGMVRQLGVRMRALADSSAVKALDVSTLAVDVAHELDVTSYPGDVVITLRGQSLRDQAFMLSYMGRFPEARKVCDAAERLFRQIPVPDYELARLQLVRAHIVGAGLDRYDEAISLARQSAETFHRFGDTSRYVTARRTEAAMLYEHGDIREALDIWLGLQRDMAPEGLANTRLTHDIALCRRQLGDVVHAIDDFARCAAEFQLLGMDVEYTRARWNLGQTLVIAGRPADAVPVLREAWRSFESLEMISDAGLAALELVEALLLIGQPEQIPAICRDLVARFVAAGSTARAVTALSFLREAIALGQTKPSLVREVHSFLRQIRDERPQLHSTAPAGALED
jgi:tetratricopeptide (TPR) repeat protein